MDCSALRYIGVGWQCIVVIMLVHEGCRTIKYGSTTCHNYDGTCDGGRIITIASHKALVMQTNVMLPSPVIKEPALVMQSNVYHQYHQYH